MYVGHISDLSTARSTGNAISSFIVARQRRQRRQQKQRETLIYAVGGGVSFCWKSQDANANGGAPGLDVRPRGHAG